eukprot:TRINITY_DN469_c0_g1_i1.p1 TRINITY_DN469_c0_g1~~TRINITY_DN469_c0_g1_i1.p1  ORF type:complete len:457 (-),score=144.85 TRINITY_DN469_c0_g1_i1:199-1569(-)
MSSTSESSKKKKVIVIGAGMAGLSAGYHLQEHSDEFEFEILEARDRVGGRVWSCSDVGDGVEVDLGGQWVHEASGSNPTVKLMQKLGGIQWEKPGKNFDRIVFDHDGAILDDQEFRDARQTFNAAESYLGISKDVLDVSKKDVSMWDVFEKYDCIKNIDMEHLETPFDRALAYFIDREQCYEGGRLTELSTSLRGMYSSYGGGDKTVGGTYKTLTDRLVEEIGLEKIRLGCIVSSIEHSDESCCVHLQDGEKLEADWVIVTVSLGILKAGDIEFSPSLPEKKQEAIETMGMGLLDKIGMKFTKQFWGDFHSFGYAAKNAKQIKWFFDQSERTGQPILLMFHGGDAARRIDCDDPELDDDAMVQEALDHLKLMFPNEEIELENSVITKWNTDPFSKGSYTFAAAGASPECWENLVEPCGRLLFAGEATVGWQYGCVHSAILSGEREVDRIVSLSKSD